MASFDQVLMTDLPVGELVNLVTEGGQFMPFLSGTGGGGGGGPLVAVQYEPTNTAQSNSIASVRLTDQLGSDPAAVGLTNLGSDTSGALPAATGNYATVSGGDQNDVSADHATVAGGMNNSASSSFSTVGGGLNNVASVGNAAVVAGGEQNTASAFAATVGGGQGHTASAAHATVSGGLANNATAIGSTVAGGSNNNATAANAYVEGENNISGGEASHAEGSSTLSESLGSHAEGIQSTASGQAAHAEGFDTTAAGASAHAEGFETTANNPYSHSEGFATTAFGDASHAQGRGAVTTLEGQDAHASGGPSTATTCYQASNCLVRGQLPGVANPETVAMALGGDTPAGTSPLTLQDGKAYIVTVELVAGSSTFPGTDAWVQSVVVRAQAGAAILDGSGVAEHFGTTAMGVGSSMVIGVESESVVVTYTGATADTPFGANVAATVRWSECPLG
jgi:hypothetical protein